MLEANRTTPLRQVPVNASLSIRDPLDGVIEEGNLVVIRAFFELLAEWESKEAEDANLDRG